MIAKDITVDVEIKLKISFWNALKLRLAGCDREEVEKLTEIGRKEI